MTIEKLSDDKIKCTLTAEDLASHRISLKDLAYGTDSARVLFREVLRNASYKFGFHSENETLAIEAIPMSADKLIVIISKISYPEEMDTRFAEYSDYDLEDYDLEEMPYYAEEPEFPEATLADDVISYYAKDEKDDKDVEKDKEFVPGIVPSADVKNKDVTLPRQLKRRYRFSSIDTLIRAAHVIGGFYDGTNTLYKDRDGSYHLVVYKDEHTPVEFNKICNNLAEYGGIEKLSTGAEGFMEEHYEKIIGDRALQSLSQLEEIE